MKHGHSFAIGILAFALIACGGNGGGGNSKSGSAGLTSTPRIEAVLSNPTSDPGYQYVDPLSIESNDVIRFQVVNYTTSGDSVTRNVLPAVFRTSDANGVAGNFTSDGSLQATSTDTGDRNYIVTGTNAGTEYVAFYNVKPRTTSILLRGKVLAEGSDKPVYNATVKFYALRNPLDPTSQLVVIATVHSAFDGTYRVSLPAFNDSISTYADAIAAPKVYFSIDSGSLPSGYYPSFKFEGARYDAGSNLCRPNILSRDVVTDPDTLETTFLPYKNGDRYLVDDTNTDSTTNGTILLTPKALYDSKPDADGCSAG